MTSCEAGYSEGEKCQKDRAFYGFSSIQLNNEDPEILRPNQCRQQWERRTLIRIGPDGKHAMRCLALGLLRDMGIAISHPESDPMSKDYVAFYHFLVGPYSDFEQSVAYVREALKKDDLTIVIED